MEILLRRLLGTYLAVLALSSVPSALLYLGIENPSGPWWILPALPLSHGVVFGAAGYLLIRRPAPAVPPDSTIMFPSVESLLQLLGVYFIVEGGSQAVRTVLEMFMFSAGWWSRIGEFGAAAVWLGAGCIIVMRTAHSFGNREIMTVKKQSQQERQS